GADIHEDDVGAVGGVRGRVAFLGELASHQLGIADVHLAAVGFDVDGAGRAHALQVGARSTRPAMLPGGFAEPSAWRARSRRGAQRRAAARLPSLELSQRLELPPQSSSTLSTTAPTRLRSMQWTAAIHSISWNSIALMF